MKFLFFIGFLSCFSLHAKIKVAVFNDLNGSLGNPGYEKSVHYGLDQIIKQRPDLLIAPGDLVAGEDFKKNFPQDKFAELWQAFDRLIHQKLKLANIPFAPAPGNHDANAALKREVIAYGDYFSRKENIPSKITFIDQKKYPFYYSYMLDNTFFVALDDTQVGKLTVNASEDESQKEWLRGQLMAPEAQNANTRIVYGHIPLYSVLNQTKHQGKFKETLSLERHSSSDKNRLENIILEGRVDLVIFGHSHAYYPGLIKHQTAKDGLHVLFAPCLGSGPRYLSGNSNTRSEKSYTIIEVDDDGSISYQVFNYKGLKVDSKRLPSQIVSNNQVIIKRDDEYAK